MVELIIATTIAGVATHYICVALDKKLGGE